MRSVQIVVDPPIFNDVPGMAIASEQVLIEAFVPQAPIEAFNEAVLHRFARSDVVPCNAAVLRSRNDSPPHQIPQPKTAGAHSKRDKNLGQGHRNPSP